MALQTRLTQALGIEHPVMLAGMGGVGAVVPAADIVRRVVEEAEGVLAQLGRESSAV